MPISISGDGSIGSLSATEIGYLDGVTSAVQTQINTRATITDFPNSAWDSYTPTWTSTGGTPAIGNGTFVGYWKKNGKTINAMIFIYGGSTTTWTGTSYRFSLPSEALISFGTGSVGIYNANTGASYVGYVYHDNVNSFMVATDSGFVGATSPGTWSANWLMRINITYPGV